MFCLLVQSCQDNKTIVPSVEFQSYPEKELQIDANGNIISSDIEFNEFHSSENCVVCHDEQVNEWTRPMHAHSMKDPVFFSGCKNEQESKNPTIAHMLHYYHATSILAINKQKWALAANELTMDIR